MVEAVDVDRRAWLTLAIGSVAAFLVALDTTIVALALPKSDLFLSKTRRVAEELTNSCRLLGVVVVVV